MSKLIRKKHNTTLKRFQTIYEVFKTDGVIKWKGKIISNEWVLMGKLITTGIEMGLTPEEICKIPIKCKITKNHTYTFTDEELILLMDIENVLCKRSRQIWGLTHKKKIKGESLYPPYEYETSHDRKYDYMELVARILN